MTLLQMVLKCLLYICEQWKSFTSTILQFCQALQFFDTLKVLLRKNASIASGSSVKSSEMQLMNRAHLTVTELQVDEREIFKHVQQVTFPEVVDVLSATKCCEEKRYPKKIIKKADASIRQLNPQLKEGLFRVGDWLVNGPFGDERKHPFILPYKDHVTDLIVKQCHENLGHMSKRICFVILERDGLDCERKIGSAACFRKMHDLSMTDICMPWETVHGRFTRSEPCTWEATFHSRLCWLFWATWS